MQLIILGLRCPGPSVFAEILNLVSAYFDAEGVGAPETRG